MNEHATASRPVIVGVAGGSGSGKTTVANRVAERLGPDRMTCLQHDSYYLDRSDLAVEQRAAINYDHPDALETGLLIEHLHAMRAGESVSVPVYDFENHERKPMPVELEPRDVVLLEGILILADEKLRELMDIKVFVDTDPDLRVIRRIQRDVTERNRSLESIVDQYLNTVRPMHLEFVESSKRYADFFIPEGGFNDVAVDSLVAKIEALLENPKPEPPLS